MLGESKSSRLAVTILTAWSASVLCAFLVKREELNAISARLLDNISHLLLLLLLLLIAYALGKNILKLIAGIESKEIIQSIKVLPIGLGFGSLSLMMFVLGALGLFYPAAAYTILILGGLLCLKEVKEIWPIRKVLIDGGFNSSKSEAALLTLLALLLTLSLLGALTPPFLGDDMVYHLTAPKVYIQNHRIMQIPRNIYSYFPESTEMLYVLAMLVKGDVLAKLINYLFGALLVVAIYSFGKRMGLTEERSLLASAIFYTTPTAWFISAWAAYVDLPLAFYLTMAVFAYVELISSDKRIWAFISALNLGLALATKFTALYLIPVFFLGLAIKEATHVAKKGACESLKNIFLPVILALSVASPWYIKNIFYTNNPFFPFFLNLIPTKDIEGWDPERARNYLALLRRYGGAEKSLADYALLPWNLTVNSKPVSPQFFDGIVGPVFLMSLPAIFLLRHRLTKSTKAILYFCLLYFLFWAFSSQQIRFLIPMLPCLSLAAAFAIGGFPQEDDLLYGKPTFLRRLFLCSISAALLGNLLTIAYLFARINPLPYVAGLENRHDFLSRRLDYYALYDYINKNLPGNSKILLVNTGNFNYYLDRDYYSDFIFEDHTLGKIVNESKTPEDVRNRLKQMGVTHLLYCYPILFSKDLMPFSDEDSLRRFSQFLSRYGRLLRGDNNLHLLAIN